MKRYTIKENILSALLGVVIAIPICYTAYNSWIDEPAPDLVIETYSIPIEENYPADNRTIEVKTLTKSEPEYIGDFKTTAYCPCAKCCGEWADGITFTGTVATEGRTIAVDPKVIPLGSKVEINGSEYIAEDIGGAVDDNHIDIFFESHEKALSWEVKSLPVYMVEEN